MFAQLRPNGTLILEPQSLASYSKKARKINAVTKDNFNNMKFKPNQFVEYLINDVGFSGGEIIGTPQHSKNPPRCGGVWCGKGRQGWRPT